MIQMMTAYTTELDELEDGLKEIFSQLDIGKLKKNSAGIITCHYDFFHTNFISELCKKLPFDVVGMTTMASANEHGMSMYSLSLTVLTSDDVVFATSITDPLKEDNYREKIAAAYREIQNKSSGDPSFAIAFFPYLQGLGGADMVRAFDRASGGIPVWGSLATNFDVSYEKCHSFRNGDGRSDALALLLVHGKLDPEFVVVSIPEQNIRENRGIITDSKGCVLKKINDLPALEYIESLGVTLMKNAPTVIPLIIYYEGTSRPVSLGIYTVNNDGSLVCGGEMPVGASITIGEINHNGIVSSAEEAIKMMLESGKKNGALMLPCVTRYVMLNPNNDAEISLAASSLKGRIPYMLGYSGGEVCPVPDESGKLRNCFHNYTFTACVF